MNPLILSAKGDQYSAYFVQMRAKAKLRNLKEELKFRNLPTGIRKHFDGNNIVYVETCYGTDRIHVIERKEARIQEEKGIFIIYPDNCEHKHEIGDAISEFTYVTWPEDCEHIHVAGTPDATNCCEDPSIPDLSLDTVNTPETIAPDSYIDIYVSDGCAPFTFEITSGNGYTWNANGGTTYETDSRNAQLDCAAGT